MTTRDKDESIREKAIETECPFCTQRSCSSNDGILAIKAEDPIICLDCFVAGILIVIRQIANNK